MNVCLTYSRQYTRIFKKSCRTKNKKSIIAYKIVDQNLRSPIFEHCYSYACWEMSNRKNKNIGANNASAPIYIDHSINEDDYVHKTHTNICHGIHVYLKKPTKDFLDRGALLDGDQIIKVKCLLTDLVGIGHPYDANNQQEAVFMKVFILPENQQKFINKGK